MKTQSLDEFFKQHVPDDDWSTRDISWRLAEIAAKAAEIARACQLPQRAIAAAMGNASPSVVQRIVGRSEAHNVTLETLMRFAEACGHDLEVDFVPRVLQGAVQPSNLHWLDRRVGGARTRKSDDNLDHLALAG